MKTKTCPSSALGPCGSHLTDAKLPLASEILLNLGALYTANQVAAMMGELDEARRARGVMAGVVAALHTILPPAQFRAVMIQWEVDAIKLSEFLHIAGANETTEAITV